MTARRTFLKEMTALAAIGLPGIARAKDKSTYDPAARYELKVSEVPFRKNAAGRQLMARIYQPQGAGPFPVVLDLHGIKRITSFGVRQWSDAMMLRGKHAGVLVKVDVGFHRCGIDPVAEHAVDMIKHVAAMPGLNFRGLLSHAGHTYHAHSEDEMHEREVEEKPRLQAHASIPYFSSRR